MSQDWTDDCYAGGHAGQTDLANMEKNFQCLKTCFSGTSAPSNPLAGMWWLDTTNHILKQRNEANAAWISWFDLATGKLCAGASSVADEKVKAASGDATAGYLDAKVDNSTIEVASNQLRLKDGGITGAKLTALTAGDELFLEAPTEYVDNDTSYVKRKEITINRAGSIRVNFSLHTESFSQTVYGRVYKNGVAVGTQRSTDSTGYIMYSEDFAGIVVGDKIQLYAKTSNSSYDYSIKDFQICVADPLKGSIDLD